MRNVLATLLGAAVLAAPASAATDHADLVKGPFATGPDVTKACLACHESQAADFMKTTHWTWSARQVLDGKPVDLGKVNAV